MKPVFNKGQLNPTITTPSQLVKLCTENVNERQQALLKKYKLDQLKAYGIDEEIGTLRFLLKDESTHEFEAVPAGVWNAKENKWVWSWSNSSMGVNLYAKTAALKSLSEIINSTDFTEPARRAERDMIAMDRRYAVPPTFKQYMNRLADYLLVAARYSDLLHEKSEAKKSVAPVTPVPAAPVASAPANTTDALVAEVLARLGGPKVLDLDRAKRLIEAVELRAKELGKRAVIAVSNAEGNPVAVHVMDGAFLVSYEVAIKKAYTAVAVKMSTMELSALCQPGGTFYGLQALDKVITFGGGIPLYRDGVIVGGLGVSGGTGEEDHDLALYGEAVFRTL